MLLRSRRTIHEWMWMLCICMYVVQRTQCSTYNVSYVRTYTPRYSRYDFNCVLEMEYMRTMDGWSNVLRYGFSLQVSQNIFYFSQFLFCLFVCSISYSWFDRQLFLHLFIYHRYTQHTYTQTAVLYEAVAVQFYMLRMYI